jgi:hypothetical protein
MVAFVGIFVGLLPVSYVVGAYDATILSMTFSFIAGGAFVGFIHILSSSIDNIRKEWEEADKKTRRREIYSWIAIGLVLVMEYIFVAIVC